MVTVKQLENQRINEIKELNSDEVKSYVDSLVKKEFISLANYDDELFSYIAKVEEVDKILNFKYNNLNNYINNSRFKCSLDLFLYNTISDLIVDTCTTNKKIIDLITRLKNNLFNLEQLLKATYRTYDEFKDSGNIESILNGFTSSIESIYNDSLDELAILKNLITNKIDLIDFDVYIQSMKENLIMMEDNILFDEKNVGELISRFIVLLEFLNQTKLDGGYHKILDYYSEKLDESRNPLEPFSLLSYLRSEEENPDDFDEFLEKELKFDFKSCSFIYP